MSISYEQDFTFILLKKILKEREKSAILIQKNWKGKQNIFIIKLVYKSKLEMKKLKLIKSIISNRIYAEKKIYIHIKNYLYRIKVLKLIQKLKSYYSIIPSFQNTKNIKIQIKLGKEKAKIYYLKFCPIRKQFVFDIPRNFIQKFNYKFFFIINDIKIIDQKYDFIKIKNGYVNIINFRKIQDKEFFLEKVYDKEIEAYFSSNSTSETNSKTSGSSIDSCDYIFRKNNTYNNLNLELRKKFISQNRLNSQINSILKNRNYNRGKSSKKISFGKIEIFS